MMYYKSSKASQILPGDPNFFVSLWSEDTEMQHSALRFNDYGEFILEIDRLVRSDREELVTLGGSIYQAPILPRLNTAHVSAGGNAQTQPNSARESRPLPTFWQQASAPGVAADASPASSSDRCQDSRQIRLFKTRFCSYGMECPYLAKGKCLYAHNKDEIRLRPPPPTRLKVNVRDSPIDAPDQSQNVISDSVWSLPESSVDSEAAQLNEFASLFDCLQPARPLASSSIVLNVASSIDC
jgi:hypothetical protein